MTGPGGPWAARLPLEDAAAAATLRLLPGVVAAVAEEALWLRGPDLREEVDAALRRVPGLARFRVLDGCHLARVGEQVPGERLPALSWEPVADVLVPEAALAALAGARPAGRVPLRLVRSSQERAAGALLTDLGAWSRWCAAAPAVRLAALRFAAASDGRVLVLGRPLPAIAGATPLWEQDGLLFPCGFAPSPDVGASVLRAACGLGEGECALLGRDSTLDVVPSGAWVAASRSATRLTESSLGPR